MKLPDGLRIALNQAGVEVATFYPSADSWTLVTRPGGKRTESEVPNDELKGWLAAANTDRIEGEQTRGTRG